MKRTPLIRFRIDFAEDSNRRGAFIRKVSLFKKKRKGARD
jgi:hypothetical protein